MDYLLYTHLLFRRPRKPNLLEVGSYFYPNFHSDRPNVALRSTGWESSPLPSVLMVHECLISQLIIYVSESAESGQPRRRVGPADAVRVPLSAAPVHAEEPTQAEGCEGSVRSSQGGAGRQPVPQAEVRIFLGTI